MDSKMVICVKCKYHGDTPTRLNTRYKHVCKHPKTKRTKGIDPVTGGKCYPGGQQYPYCRDLNDGSCKRFKQ